MSSGFPELLERARQRHEAFKARVLPLKAWSRLLGYQRYLMVRSFPSGNPSEERVCVAWVVATEVMTTAQAAIGGGDA